MHAPLRLANTRLPPKGACAMRGAQTAELLSGSTLEGLLDVPTGKLKHEGNSVC